MWMKQIISPSTRQLAKGKMSKPSHRVMLTKLFFYLNFLFWQHLGTQLKFQARADAVQPAANGTTTTVEPLLPQNEVSTLTDVIFKLGVDSPSNITRTYCTLPIPTNGISIRCNCSYKQNTECHIRSISLYKSGLTAVIPEEVGALRYLTDLDLSNSKLQGPIPAALGDLYDLEYLDLSRNQLTGSIPDLGSLRNLRFLDLHRNLLEGTIPPTLGLLVKLEMLELRFNKLSGSIPDDLGKLVNLISLDISENQLTGPLPEIGELKNLTYFLAAANSLTGAFPESYGELTSLEAFIISGNYISGPLPVAIIKRWTKIEVLLLLGNNFKGKVTKEVFNLPDLEHLHISDLEDATFELPSKITNTKYVSLILRNCSIHGSIPKYIGDQMTSLNYLDLSFNNLTGELPEYMKSDILYMSFSTNMLNGTIPAWIFWTVKTRIDLSFNNFTALESGVPRNKELNLFACCRNSATTQMRDPLEMMMNTNCLGKEQKYHSLFINCGGGETTVNGETYEQDNDTSSFFTSPNKNWAYSSSGSGGFLEGNTSYIKNMTCGVSIAEAPLYDRARLSPVSLKYYAFCLREGKYNVTLKFAEIFYTDDTDYTSLRKRAFDIYIQDDKIKRDFNIEEQAGGPDKPITRSFTAVVNKTNPLLKIHLYWDGKGSIGVDRQTKRSVICLARETAVLMAQVVEKPHVTDDHDDVNQKLMSNDGIVVPNPKPSKGLTSKLVDLVEKLIVKLMYDSSQPHHYLAGNFAPVIEETPPTKDLNVIGHLPDCLNGEFVRVGPNPKFAPVAGYHWFDGDGMIHGMRIKDGKATYVSRYVKTSRLKQEEYFGGAKFMKIGDLKGLFGLLMVNMQQLRAKLKVVDLSYGHGTSNTALIYHHGKLLALSEGDKPYVLKVLEDGDLQTVGLLDYDKRLKHSFTAHPKVDPFTGEMFTFGYSHDPPYITYRVVSKDGFMHDPVPITVPAPIMMHDFAITENYAIFMDLPLYFRPKEMVKEGKLIFSFDETKKARFGVLPRYAKDDLLIRWFELPNCFIFHNANAWEEEDEVVLITCRLENPDLDMVNGPIKKKLDTFKNELYEMRFNLKTGLATQKKLSESAVDFPRVNESYTGRKQRFVYGTTLDSIAKVTGIVKFDLHAAPEVGKTNIVVGGNVQGLYDLGPGRFGSEAIFVPRVPGITSEEDDGYLIFFVHDENTGKSAIHVLDAKTMSNDPVAVVELPHRVPYGFHAFFVTEEQLQEQANL